MSDGQNHKVFNPGEELTSEGAPNDQAFLILNGKVEIRTGTKTSHPQVIATLGQGEVIGEMSIYDDGPAAASAVAMEETKVSVLTRQEFQKRLEDMDPVMKGVLGVLIRRLREMVANSVPTMDDPAAGWSGWKKD